MKIGIDASRYSVVNPTGVENYVVNILNNLVPVLGRDHTLEVILYTKEEVRFGVDFPFNVRQKVLKREKGWTKIALSLEMLREKPDLLFVPGYFLPFFAPKKSIWTVHDVAFMVDSVKEAYDEKSRKMLIKGHKRCCKLAAKIIVPSKSTKDDLMKYFGVEEGKIEVIYHGLDEKLRHAKLKQWKVEEKEALFGKFGLNSENSYMLFVGRIELKKNLLRVVEAFARFSGEFMGWKLVLAGKDGEGAALVRERVKELGLEENVIFTGYVSELEKEFLYNFARFVVYATLYEGFGFNVLEAFAFEKPLIASGTSATGEIAGEGCARVNPEKLEEISVAMKRLVMDWQLQKRVVEKSRLILDKFSWEKAALSTFKVIEDLIEGG